MPSMKAIKRKLVSVASIQQIMRAMNLVAAAKLQRAKSHLETAYPVVRETKRIIGEIKSLDDVAENHYVKPRVTNRALYIVITSDRGLCGGYNANVSKVALDFMEKKQHSEVQVIAVGLKAWEFFVRRGKKVIHRFTGMSGKALYADAISVGGLASSMFVLGDVDEVYVAYTQFKSTVTHVPCVEKLLPIDCVPPPDGAHSAMQYEPDANAFLENTAQMYVNTFIYGAMADSSACEQAACMVSMDAASNNASEIIDDLSLMYNRLRQGSITQEITEIVSGTNALK